MAELDKVKVGDKLYVWSWRGQSIETVVRVTKTLVIIKGHRFSKANGRLYGGGAWDTMCARPATEEDVQNIQARKRRADLIHACKHIDYEEFSTPQLESIISFIKNIKDNGKEM